MARVFDAGKAHPDRTVLSNRFYGARWFVAAATGALGVVAAANNDGSAWTLGSLAALAVLYYLVTHTKRALFDDGALYFVRGKAEEKIAFQDIVAIKATGVQIVGHGLWRLEYKDHAGLAQKHLFRARTALATDFVNLVQAANPLVTIWWHYYFGHGQK